MATTHMNIDGMNIVPAADAGSEFGYTTDYITKLAREGKVEGIKVGRQWFVSLASLTRFVGRTKLTQAARREALSLSRKEEFKTHTQVNKKTDTGHTKHTHAFSPLSLASGTAPAGSWRRGQAAALLQTVAVLMVGVSLGGAVHLGGTYTFSDMMRIAASYENDMTLFLASVGTLQYDFFEELAVGLYHAVSVSGERHTRSVARKEPSAPVAPPTAPERPVAGTHEGVVLVPDDGFSKKRQTHIEHSFSDEVSVLFDSDNPNSGVIIPQFKGRAGEEYRFLMVPVEAASPPQ